MHWYLKSRSHLIFADVAEEELFWKSRNYSIINHNNKGRGNVLPKFAWILQIEIWEGKIEISKQNTQAFPGKFGMISICSKKVWSKLDVEYVLRLNLKSKERVGEPS